MIATIACCVWTVYIFLLVRIARWKSQLVDLAEFFCAFHFFILHAAIAVLQFLDLSSDKDSLLSLPIFGLLLCAVRTALLWQEVPIDPRNEEEAAELLERAAELLARRDSGKPATLLLAYHRKLGCAGRADCECRCFRRSASWPAESRVALPLNRRVYVCEKNRPELSSKGARATILRLLVADLRARFGNKAALHLNFTIAEIQFYYFANPYQAWEQTIQTLSAEPPLAFRQRAYNLIRTIDSGFSYSDDPLDNAVDEGNISLMQALAYSRHYNRFLDLSEEATEVTISFWSALLLEKPRAHDLNALGKRLFEVKCQGRKCVKSLLRIREDHFEFLVRYGLFERYVMHDRSAADEVFSKILGLAKSGNESAVTVGDSEQLVVCSDRTMLIVANVDPTGECTVREASAEVEQELGYSKAELVGFSVVNIMPPIVARCHGRIVRAFIQSMSACSINHEKLRFLKGKDGVYIPCRCTVRLVPSLMDGLRFALIASPESLSFREVFSLRHHERTKVGAILCDDSFSVIGFTKEASAVLTIPEQQIRDLVKNSRIGEVFPQLSREQGLEEATSLRGVVMDFSPGNSLALTEQKVPGMDTPAVRLRVRMETEEFVVPELPGGEKLRIFYLADAREEEFTAPLTTGLAMLHSKIVEEQTPSLPGVADSSTVVSGESFPSSSGDASGAQQKMRVKNAEQRTSSAIRLLFVIILCLLGGVAILICIRLRSGNK